MLEVNFSLLLLRGPHRCFVSSSAAHSSSPVSTFPKYPASFGPLSKQTAHVADACREVVQARGASILG